MRILLVCFFVSLPLTTFAQITFEDKEIEITARADQEKVKFVFPFKNSGNEAVEIINVNLTCSCLSAKTDKEKYSPGESGKLEAIFSIGSFTGVQRKSMTLTSQQDGKEKTRDSLLAILTIPEVITIEPELIKWKVNEEPAEKVFTIKVPHTDPISIKGVTCSREGFNFSWKEIKKGREYEIELNHSALRHRCLG